MKKPFRHGGVLLLVGVFATALLGAAYTLWYENLTLRADITTGTFNVDWSQHGVAEVISENMASGPFVAPGGSVPDAKYTQTCEITLPLVHDNPTDNANSETLTLKASGLYPYAGCKYSIDITNSGSVPAHFQLASRQVPSQLGVFIEGDASCAALFGSVGATVDGLQIHNGESLNCVVTIYLQQEAGESANYSASWGVKAHQWNENLPSPTSRRVVDSLSVSSSNPSVTLSNIVLAPGKQYAIRVNGTYLYNNFPGLSRRQADAEYVTEDTWVTHEDRDPIDLLVSFNNGTTMQDVNWGPYNAAHSYEITVVGSGNRIGFVVGDTGLTDNAGSLSVTISVIE